MIRIEAEELGRLIRAHGGPKFDCPKGELDITGKVTDDMGQCEEWLNRLVAKGVLMEATYKVY